MATTNHVQGWLCLLMTEDSSFHWRTKPQTSSDLKRPGAPVLSSFVFLDRTRFCLRFCERSVLRSRQDHSFSLGGLRRCCQHCRINSGIPTRSRYGARAPITTICGPSNPPTRLNSTASGVATPSATSKTLRQAPTTPLKRRCASNPTSTPPRKNSTKPDNKAGIANSNSSGFQESRGAEPDKGDQDLQNTKSDAEQHRRLPVIPSGRRFRGQVNPNRKIFEARKRETAALGAGEKLVLGHPLAATIGDSARCMQNLEKVLFTRGRCRDR